MHRSRILKRAFSVAHHLSSGRMKRFARISMVHPARTTRPKRCVGGKSESVTKGRGISELGVLHARQIGNSEKPSAQPSSLISAAVGVVAPRCWSKVSRAFLTSFCRNPRIAQQIGDSMSQLSRLIELDCSAANSELSGQ